MPSPPWHWPIGFVTRGHTLKPLSFLLAPKPSLAPFLPKDGSRWKSWPAEHWGLCSLPGRGVLGRAAHQGPCPGLLCIQQWPPVWILPVEQEGKRQGHLRANEPCSPSLPFHGLRAESSRSRGQRGCGGTGLRPGISEWEKLHHRSCTVMRTRNSSTASEPFPCGPSNTAARTTSLTHHRIEQCTTQRSCPHLPVLSVTHHQVLPSWEY